MGNRSIQDDTAFEGLRRRRNLRHSKRSNSSYVGLVCGVMERNPWDRETFFLEWTFYLHKIDLQL